MQKVIDDAKRLDLQARAFIIEALLERLDAGTDVEVSPECVAEIRRRCAEIDNGARVLIPGDRVLAPLRAKPAA